MATLTTPEEHARTILEMFGHFKCQAGDPLQGSKFAAIATNLDMPMDDVASGVKFATEAGWIERNADGSYKMTNAGFAEMPN